ncbi:TadE/TadG family type IV pilus assembly protein [Actinocatenispora rupis]|uniref:TadE-like domain-containing protein n=1 Tax=Actinocatenispora rupis TaxID=519421 RepID=A0A8J3NGH5_9ACTN|nr:TadE/TadG family type IV pilus assembly protein [Actinocatenispora rupis]GID14879.1 hypothetical protein Aru02nite_57680 [Actinocatenispora rupis]
MKTKTLRARLRGDSGATTIEAIYAVVILLVLLGIVVAFGRATGASTMLTSAAHEAARAASLARSPGSARADAQRSATASVRQGHAACPRLHTAVDTSRFLPGGQVTVILTCHIRLADLPAARALPGTITASSTSPVDRFRGVSP